MIVERGGTYILKLQNPHYEELSENENLTMRLIKTTGIDIPIHGMIYCKDSSFTYFIKRFDRYGRNKKRAVEDFCTFPIPEKVKLLRLTLFNFLVANEDMHLKIFSLFKLNEKWQLTPAYDLLNSAIYMKEPEYLALALMGKRKKIQRQHFIDYFAKERLGLPRKITSDLLKKIYESTRSWEALIEISFMSLNLKEKYAKEV